MTSIDVFAVDISIELLTVFTEPSKPLVTVRNIKPTIQGSLKLSIDAPHMENENFVPKKQKK